MKLASERVREIADQFVSTLEGWERAENRGPLARLRRGLSETTRHQAWPVLGAMLGRLRIHEIPVSHPVLQTLAGCFALHRCLWEPNGEPREDRLKNMGWTYRQVRLAEPKGEEKMADEKEPHTRFRRLLACADQKEICEHVRHAVVLAKSREVPVNFRNLFLDLFWWSDRAKVEWAKAYWHVPEEPAGFNLVGAGAPMPDEEPLIPE